MPTTGWNRVAARGLGPAVTREERFLALWAEARAAVGAYILARVADHAVADDLEQDTICAAWAAFDRYDATRSFGAWVMGIARHKVGDRLRGTARPEILDPFLSEPAVDEVVDELAARREALAHCLDELDAAQRELLERYYQRDEGSGVIAAKSGMSLNHLRVRLHRLRAGLRRCVERRLRGEEHGA